MEGLEIETTCYILSPICIILRFVKKLKMRKTEYEFTYYHQNKKQKSLEIEIEQEWNVNKISIEDKDYAGNLNNKMEFEMMDNKILCDIETKNYKGEVVIIIQGNRL